MSDLDKIIESANARAERFSPDKFFWRKIKVRKGPKKHSVNRERSHEEQARNRSIKLANIKKAKTFADYKELVKKYWRGEIDNYPESIK
jgi:hypothetical protein